MIYKINTTQINGYNYITSCFLISLADSKNVDSKYLTDTPIEISDENGKLQYTLENGVITKRVQEDSNQDIINQEILRLKRFLIDSNYIATNYGALRTNEKKELFLADISDTYNKTNEEVLDERDEAIARINELSATLES